eukprot:scaffold4637_cov144-Skeletonema_menzelii.AAC.1
MVPTCVRTKFGDLPDELKKNNNNLTKTAQAAPASSSNNNNSSSSSSDNNNMREICSSSPHNDTSATLQMISSGDDEGGSSLSSTTAGHDTNNERVSSSSLPLHHHDVDRSDSTGKEGKMNDKDESFHQFLDYINTNNNNNNTNNDDEGGGGENDPQKRKLATTYFEKRRTSSASTVRTSNINHLLGSNNSQHNLRKSHETSTSTHGTLDTSLKSNEVDYTFDEVMDGIMDDAADDGDVKMKPPVQQQQQQQQPLKSRLQRQKDEQQKIIMEPKEYEKVRGSLRLSEVFDDDYHPNSNSNSFGTVSQHGASDSSSLVLDISWGSTHYDRATVMSSLEEVMMANPHMKLETMSSTASDKERSGSGGSGRGGGGGGGDGSGNTAAAAATSTSTAAIERSERSASSSTGTNSRLFSSSFGSKKGGGNSSTNSKYKNLAAMAPIAISHDGGDATMIPPVFRTRRRTSADSSTTGDGNVSIMSGGGGGGVPPLPFRPWKRRTSVDSNCSNARDGTGSTFSVEGGGTEGGGQRKRPSFDGGRLRNNTARNRDDDNNMEPIVHVDGGGDGGSGEFFSKTLGFKQPSVRTLSDNKSIGSGILGGISFGGSWRRRPSTDSVSTLGSAAVPVIRQPLPPNPRAGTPPSPGRRMEVSNSSHNLLLATRTEQGSKSSRSRYSQYSNKTASSVGVDDMDLSVVDSQAVQTSGNGGGEDNGDQELVAALGGSAYLKATKKVWAMRIIVISTFVGKCTRVVVTGVSRPVLQLIFVLTLPTFDLSLLLNSGFNHRYCIDIHIFPQP